jgi:hypothetical protein
LPLPIVADHQRGNRPGAKRERRNLDGGAAQWAILHGMGLVNIHRLFLPSGDAA